MSFAPDQPSILDKIHDEIAKLVIGQAEMVEQMLLTVLCAEHSLMESVAGQGKWLAVRALARCLALDATKLRCSPDLTRQEITGEPDADSQRPAGLARADGPLMGNLVLVDNIDRLSPKADGLIQRAMQERQLVSPPLDMPNPFVVFATRQLRSDQQPIAAGLHDDRFLFKIAVPYPTYSDEYGVAQAAANMDPGMVQPIVSAADLVELKAFVKAAHAPPSVAHYTVRLVRATRVHEGENLDFVYEWVEQGAGPRAVQSLMLASNARAIIRGCSEADHSDVAAMALPTLRHRILTNRNAQENGISVDRVIERLLEEVPRRIAGDEEPPKKGEAFNVHNWIERDV